MVSALSLSISVTVIGSAYEAPCLVGIVSGGGDTRFVLFNDLIFMWGLVLPMSFLCGTFFKTTALPEALRIIIELLPLTHTSYLLRELGAGGTASAVSVAVLLIYAALCFWLCRRAFSRLTC